MKRVIFIVGLALILSSCKSKQTSLSGKKELETEQNLIELPAIQSKMESFTFADASHEAQHSQNPYFVILGSFKRQENAARFSETLKQQNFEPFILLSETGMHRVSVASFPQPETARAKVLEIRSNYPSYQDCWMLVKKQMGK